MSILALELGEQLSKIDSEECGSNQNNGYAHLCGRGMTESILLVC